MATGLSLRWCHLLILQIENRRLFIWRNREHRVDFWSDEIKQKFNRKDIWCNKWKSNDHHARIPCKQFHKNQTRFSDPRRLHLPALPNRHLNLSELHAKNNDVCNKKQNTIFTGCTLKATAYNQFELHAKNNDVCNEKQNTISSCCTLEITVFALKNGIQSLRAAR